MSYAILRTAKLTSFANVSSSASHNFRERQTINADPERTHSNTTSGAQSAAEVVAAVKTRLETVPTVRKNAVLAVEYFIGASPEWFKEQSPKVCEAYFDEAEKWLKARHGAENVIAFTRQYDETSPHVCAYVVPIDPKGKLNCSYFLDGRIKLSEMQTEFAEKVGRRFNLERGIEGSKARHTTVKKYYSEIQKPVSEITIKPEDLKPKKYKEGFLGKIGINTHTETPEGIAERLTEAVRESYRPAVSAAERYAAEKVVNAARERQLVQLREMATQARELPLNAVLERLGATQDAGDKKNWRTPAGRVTVDGVKFFNHDTGKGGGGAIDLVMHQTDSDYKGAVGWLAQEFGTGAVLADTITRLKPTIEEAKRVTSLNPLKAHQPEPKNWSIVRRYLVETRRLSADVVDSLHEEGCIYADKFKNAVFRLGKTGLNLRGTGEKPFHGVRGDKMPFLLQASDKTSRKVAFVESPIDALSLRELGFNGRIVATVGNAGEVVKNIADMYIKNGLNLVSAFDNDKAGEVMTRNLGICERMRPNYKDWNEDLAYKKMSPEQKRVFDLERREQRSRSSGISR